ncbi:MAG: FAD-binding oxidoreductase [Defluviimonas sp.]|uniref:NAD(P)/FAD-dependent oxidoreductase n=1 Tax=Albidovulum sp. TaxID=1872424 RepID=UPI001E0CA217|nr:FAD-binding oxidoreductase [Paracoccaceae bacterium]MCC0063214.1 FAD-binding oxidoreductase [Defluviimonas sp.]
MATADVTVMGGGIFGLAIAWECLGRGARVRVCERSRIGAGSSGGVVGALAPHVPENWNPKKAFQLASLLAAEAFWDGVAQAGGGSPGYARSGRVQPLADPRAVEIARARSAGARQFWGDAAEWRVVPALRDGWQGESGSGWIVEDTLSARLCPRGALAALAAAIRACGGEIALGTDAPGASGPVIWATGVEGLAALSRDLGDSVGTGVKGQAALFACAAAGRPQLFDAGLHVVPHEDGTVAVGSTSERSYDDGETTDERLDAIVARARKVCPALAEAPVIGRWAGVRPRARSRSPMLGPWPGRPGVFIANGGFKIGFGIAPGVARAMADLVLEGRDTIPEGFGVEDNLEGRRTAGDGD